MANSADITLYKWQINNFSSIANVPVSNGVLFSNAFSIYGTDLEFRLEFCPMNCDSRTHSSVHIRSNRIGKNVKLYFYCDFWLENTKGDKIMPQQANEWILMLSTLYFGYDDFIPHNELYKSNFILDNDVIIICCSLQPANGARSEWSESSEVCTNELSDDFVTIGCIIRAGDEKFYISKELLSSKSEVFKELLANNNGIVEIADIRPEIMKIILDYICYDKIWKTSNALIPLVDNIYIASIRFKLDGLKKTCMYIFQKSFKSGNVFHRLLMGYKYEDEIMIRISLIALKYNFNNAQVINYMESENWDSFVENVVEDGKLGDKMKKAIMETLE